MNKGNKVNAEKLVTHPDCSRELDCLCVIGYGVPQDGCITNRKWIMDQCNSETNLEEFKMRTITRLELPRDASSHDILAAMKQSGYRIHEVTKVVRTWFNQDDSDLDLERKASAISFVLCQQLNSRVTLKVVQLINHYISLLQSN
jgi:hypothetical protein